MASHSSTLAWKIPWMQEPGRLQSMGSLRIGHDWVTSLSLFTFMHWRRKWQPTPVFLPGESQGWGSLVVYGVAQSLTRLKWLSNRSLLVIYFIYGEGVKITQPYLTLFSPPARLLCPWYSPGKNTGVGCHFLHQEIFPNYGLNLGFLYYRLSLRCLKKMQKQLSPCLYILYIMVCICQSQSPNLSL